MRLFTISFIFCFFSCINSSEKHTPQEMAQEACECLKMSNTPEFVDCDSKIQETLKPYESDFKWMGEFRDELMKNLNDCMGDVNI